MRTSCCQIVGFILLAITNLALIIAIATPFWVQYGPERSLGLCGSCNGTDYDCTNEGSIFRQAGHTLTLISRTMEGITFKENAQESWFKATQGLMLTALVLGILALIVATLSICCTCINCSCCTCISCTCCSCYRSIIWFLVLASLCIAVAVVVFGIKANQEWQIDFQMDISSSGSFGWSFWTAIGAAGGALLTSVIYCCMDQKSS